MLLVMGKVQKWRALIYRMIAKQGVKNERIKRKQTCSVSFVKVFKFQENKFKIAQKKFLGNDKKHPGKPIGHGDHYMINMGHQRPKIGSN